MVKKRLRLIATMVAKGNRRTTETVRLFQQKILPRQAAGLFQADLLHGRQCRDINPLAHKRNLQLCTEGTGKVGITATLRTDSVIKVGGNKSKLQGGGNSAEKMEERHRIAAAREGDQDSFLRANQPVTLEPL
jgi:hypothetical protein